MTDLHKLLRECRDHFSASHGFSLWHSDAAALLKRIDAALDEPQEQNVAPQPSTADQDTAPSQEGVGQGDAASATPDATPRTDALNREHYHSSMADAAGMGTEIPCEEAYGQIYNLSCELERELTTLRASIEAAGREVPEEPTDWGRK